MSVDLSRKAMAARLLNRLINFRALSRTIPVRMPVTDTQIKEKLTKQLEAEYVEVIDESDGCGEKFSCLVVSEKFSGKPLLQRHRLVNAVLKEELATIHAFSQKTLTPDQWRSLQEGGEN